MNIIKKGDLVMHPAMRCPYRVREFCKNRKVTLVNHFSTITASLRYCVPYVPPEPETA